MAKRQCPDCGGNLAQMFLVDKTHNAAHDVLEYRVPDSKKSFWTGKFPLQGQVLSLMCMHCSRIFLYGYDYAKAAEKKAQQQGELSVATGPRGALSPPED